MSNYKKTKRGSEFIPYNPSVIESKWQKNGMIQVFTKLTSVKTKRIISFH